MNSDLEFEELFLAHYPRLVKILVRLVGHAGQAEELASDAFCRFYQHRRNTGAGGGTAPEAENPAGWLYRAAVNLGLDALRANARRSRREEKAHREEAESGQGSPLYELLAEEQRERVRTAIRRLKPIQGQVLLMGSSGFTCKEMAQMLGLKTDSLYVLISRAKAQFEKEYVSLYGRAE